MPGTDEDEKPPAARADGLAVDADGGPRDPLDDGAHRAILYPRRVGVVELRDRDVIASFCRRRPADARGATGDSGLRQRQNRPGVGQKPGDQR